MQAHLQQYRQSEEMIQLYIQTAKLDTLPICLIQQEIDILARNRRQTHAVKPKQAIFCVEDSGRCLSAHLVIIYVRLQNMIALVIRGVAALAI